MTTNISHKNSQGFTLVETLIAIAILLIAVVGPISLIGNSIHNLYFAKDEMIAINLAQEGVEVVRRVRDSNLLSPLAWNTNLAAGDYLVNVNPANMLPSCPACAGAPQPIYIGGQGFYQQSAVGTTTPFKRVVTITSITANESRVVCTVTWKTGGTNGTVSVSENIFKWTP